MTHRSRLELSSDEKAALYEFLVEIAPNALQTIARRYAAGRFDGGTDEMILAAYAAHRRGEMPTTTDS